MEDSIDIVFVSNCTNSYLWLMTANAIRTARKYAGMSIGEVVVVEENRLANPQDAKMLYYDFEFNYNKCLNLGFSVCKSKYIAFCNNDLYFENNWAKNAVFAMKSYGYLSTSPTRRHIFKGVKEGWEVGKTLLGWCIIIDRIVMDMIGQLDYPVKFWYSDDVYATQLEIAGIKHALVGNSRVKHYTSSSLRKVVNSKKRALYQRGQRNIFNKYKAKKYADSGIKIKAQESKGNRSKHRI